MLTGYVLLVVGVLLLVLPGPGLIVVATGLALLRAEFVWADRLLARVRARIPVHERGAKRGLAAVLAACGLASLGGTWLLLAT
ncbi:MAG: PGPGW domain-containing protein [Acidimicrobiia bacterium]